jgi:hypothetical protein
MVSLRAPSKDVYRIFLSTVGEEMTHARTYNRRRVRVRLLVHTIRTSCAMNPRGAAVGARDLALGHTASAKGSAQDGEKRSTQGLP